jgi:gallidermin/nisin family lantibiotic
MDIKSLGLDKVENINSKINVDQSPFDIDMQSLEFSDDVADRGGMITSKSLCTPGCGMTGTKNSFCC